MGWCHTSLSSPFLFSSQVGSRQSHPGSQLHSRQNPAWYEASSPGSLFHAKSRQSYLGSRNLTWGHLFVTQTGSHLLSFLITHKSQFQLWNMSNNTWGPKTTLL